MALSQTKLEEIRSWVNTRRAEAESGNKPVFRRMTKCQRFKIGYQWDKNVVAQRYADEMHTETINQVLPIVNHIVGEQVKNPRDLTAVAEKGGNQTRARLLTALMKQVIDSSHGQHHQTNAFDNGVTTCRGYLGIDTTYLSDPFGDLQLCTYGPFSVLPDPQRKRYDPNDWRDGWRFVFIDEWEPKFKIDTQFPGKKHDLAHSHYGGAEHGSGWLGRIVSYFFPGNEAWDTRDDYRDASQAEDPEPDPRTKWEDHYRVSTCYWRDWRKGVYLQRLDVPDWFVVLYRPRDIGLARRLIAEAEAAGSPSPVKLIEKGDDGLPLVVPVLMRTRMVGDVLLDHTEDPFEGIWKYPIVPFNAYFEDGIEFSVVDNLIGPQEICNWGWSTLLNLIKKLANTGWKVARGDPAAKRDLEIYGKKDGVVIDESLYGGKVEKLVPSPYPTAFHNVVEASSLQMREIANVRTERPEFDAKNMSGIALAHKRASSEQGSAILFRNFDMTLEILGRVLIDHIMLRRTYTRDEILQLVDQEDLVDAELLAKARELILQGTGLMPVPPTPPDPELLARVAPETQKLAIAEYQEHLQAYALFMLEVDKLAPQMASEMLLDELKDIQQGKTKFGVRSSLGESATTFREMKFAQLMALDETLRARGEMGVPRDAIIKATDIANKEQLLQQQPQAAAVAA